MEWSNVPELWRLVLAIVGAGVTVAGWLRFVWPLCGRACAAYRVADGFARKFGPDAGATVRRIVEDLGRRASLAEIKAQIIERHLRVGVFVAEADGRFSFVNDVLADMFGIDAGSMVGYGWLDGVEEKRRVFEGYKFAIQNGVPYEDSFVVHNRRSNVRSCAHSVAYGVRVDSVLVGFVGFVERVDGASGRCLVARGVAAKCPIAERGECPVLRDGAYQGT